MKFKLRKYFNENDTTHSMLRLLSFMVGTGGLLLTVNLTAMNWLSISIDPNLIDLNIWMYGIALGGKALQKLYESKFFTKITNKFGE